MQAENPRNVRAGGRPCPLIIIYRVYILHIINTFFGKPKPPFPIGNEGFVVLSYFRVIEKVFGYCYAPRWKMYLPLLLILIILCIRMLIVFIIFIFIVFFGLVIFGFVIFGLVGIF